MNTSTASRLNKVPPITHQQPATFAPSQLVDLHGSANRDMSMAKQFEQRRAGAGAGYKHNSSSDDDSFRTSCSNERADSVTAFESSEVSRLKKQLESTIERMAQMDLEINQFRLAQRTVEHAIGSPFISTPEVAFRPNAADREILLKPFPALPSHNSFANSSQLPAMQHSLSSVSARTPFTMQ